MLNSNEKLKYELPGFSFPFAVSSATTGSWNVRTASDEPKRTGDPPKIKILKLNKKCII